MNQLGTPNISASAITENPKVAILALRIGLQRGLHRCTAKSGYATRNQNGGVMPV
jgi:hypothetical protein